MDDKETRTLQLFYAALMVDSAAQFERLGASAQVAEIKAAEQALAAPGQLAQLGVTSPEGLFRRFSALFGCAAWTLESAPRGLRAETPTCLACAIAKRRGAGRPCDLYCINPLRALAAALPVPADLQVEETLWDGGRCVFVLRS